MTSTNVFVNLIWRLFERIGAKLISVALQLVLARILAPEAFGTVSIVIVITDLLQVFVESGFGTALIQKKDADDLDFSSVFYFNLFAGVVLYILLFLCAPLLAELYKDPELTAIFRVVGINLIIFGVRNVQQAYVAKNMQFRKFFFANLGGQICAFVVGVVLALKDFGVWAYVAQYLVNYGIGTAILWAVVPWRPTAGFSPERLRSLFSYGWKLLLSSILNTISDKIRPLLIGVSYTTEDLAYYNQGVIFPNLIVENVNTSIDSVLLPALSAEQEDAEKLKAMTRRAIRVSGYVLWPLMFGLFVCSEDLVLLLLTEKWLPCVFYIQVFSLYYALFPVHTANLNAIKAVGRSDLFLKLEIVKKVLDLIVVVVTMMISVKAMALGLLAEGILCLFINSYPNKRLISYGFSQQLKDILPSFAMAAVMAVTVYLVSLIPLPLILSLILQILCGIAVYLLLSVLTKSETFSYILSLGMRVYHEKKKN